MSTVITNSAPDTFPVFNVVRNGEYPYEDYEFSPIDLAALGGVYPAYFGNTTDWSQLDGKFGVVLPPSLGSFVTYQFLNYHRNPFNSIVKYSDPYLNDIIIYGGSNPPVLTIKSTDPKFTVAPTNSKISSGQIYIERPTTITFYNSSIVKLDFKTLRQTYKTPYEFYFFGIQVQDGSDTLLPFFYGFLLYPKKIFLRPLSLQKTSTGTWKLSARLCMIDNEAYHFQSEQIAVDAYNHHYDRLQNTPKFVDDLTSIQNLSFGVSISAAQMFINHPVLTFQNTKLAQVSTANLTPDGATDGLIHPDSTFLTYSGIFVDPSDNNKTKPLLQAPRDISHYFNVQQFNPSYIYDFDVTQSNVQQFQLLQGFYGNIPTDADFSSTQYCVLSCDFDLDNNQLILRKDKPSNITMYGKLNADYILERGSFIGGTDVRSTIVHTSMYIPSIGQYLQFNNPHLISEYLNPDGTFPDIVIETTYPFYTYSYNVTLRDTNSNYLDNNTLNFYLKMSASNITQTGATIKSYIASDFNLITHQLDTDTDAQIAYEIIAAYPVSVDYALSGVSASVGQGIHNTSYDIKTGGVLVDAPVGNTLQLNFTDANLANKVSGYSGITLSVKSTLSGAKGGAVGKLDSFDALNVTYLLPDNPYNNLFINVLNEGSNTIDVDSSFNNNLTAWPYKDLTNSTIVWTHNRYDLFDLDFYYIDENGNNLGPVVGPTTFSDQTARVRLDGYGPNQIVITLSSQKYTDQGSVSTHPGLFNYLSEGKLIVGPSISLNNLNQTRTITLTAAVPFKNKLFTVPDYIAMNWTWQYDNTTDPNLQPIVAKNNGNYYYYSLNSKSSQVSSMSFEISPGYAKVSPNNHTVTIYANINSVQPPVTGSYTFSVDDFPDPSIFNADFKLYYSDFLDSQYPVLDTRNGNNVMTRPNEYLLNFKASSYNDVTSTVSNLSSNWYIDGYSQNINNQNFDLTINNLTQKTLNNLPVCSLSLKHEIQGIPNGWLSAHNISSTISAYILNSTDFYQSLKFIIYPEYAWIDNGSPYLTVLDDNNFTSSYRPSAYLNKVSNSQTWWLSANSYCFDEYLYQSQQNYIIVSTKNPHDLLDIPYSEDSIDDAIGIPISLFAYNTSFYPEGINHKYVIAKPVSVNTAPALITKSINGQNYALVYETYNTSAITIQDQFPTSDLYNNFFLSPLLLYYSDVTVNSTYYTVTGSSSTPANSVYINGNYYSYLNDGNSINVDEIDKNVGANIYVMVDYDTYPSGQPSQIVDGSLTYYLSTKYWVASSVITLNQLITAKGFVPIFYLNYGDPSVLLNTGTEGPEYMNLYYDVNFYQQIPPSVFKNYPRTNNDLWSVINVTS